MPFAAVPRLLACLALAIALSACSARYQTPRRWAVTTTMRCARAGGLAAGSPEYVACRKDRDVQRNAATSRADRRQRDLGEYMLNHPRSALTRTRNHPASLIARWS